MKHPAALRASLFPCVVACALAGATLFTARAVASPPPPPPSPPQKIKITFVTHPHGNSMGPQYVVRMKMWYNDTLFYEGSARYQQDFPDGLSSGTFKGGGTLRTELAILDTSGKVLTTNTQTRSPVFDGVQPWLAGQVFTPDQKWTQSWTTHFNKDYSGYLQLQFGVGHQNY